MFEAHAGNDYLQIRVNDELTEEEFERAIIPLRRRDSVTDTTCKLLWFLSFGMTVALLLTVAEPLVSRNWHGCVTQGSIGLVMGLIGCVLVYAFINRLYNLLQGDGQAEFTFARQILARTISWSVLGALLRSVPVSPSVTRCASRSVSSGDYSAARLAAFCST